MNRFIFPALLLCATLLAGPAFAEMSQATADFVRAAQTINQYEEASNQLALKRSKSEEVRAYSQTTLQAYSQISDSLKITLGAVGTGIDSVNGVLSNEQQTTLTRLEKIRLRYFDNVFANREMDMQREALQLYSTYAKSGDDETLKKFAADMVPRFQQLVEHAQKLK